MEINIFNCNNIVSGKINLEKGKLNIKYGINGTGKSTISKAIKAKIENPEELKNLLPYGKNTSTISEVTFNGDEFKKISIFDENYISQFIFKEEELVENSFEIFIKDDIYIKNENEILKLLKEIKNYFKDNEKLEKFISDLKVFSAQFKDGKSKGIKSLKNGDKLSIIPTELMSYEEYLIEDNTGEWLAWHSKGIEYLGEHSKCPYCSFHLEQTGQNSKENIEKLSTTYKSTEIKNQIEMLKIFKSLNTYFSEDTNNRIKEMTKKSEGIEQVEEEYLENLKDGVSIR